MLHVALVLAIHAASEPSFSCPRLDPAGVTVDEAARLKPKFVEGPKFINGEASSYTGARTAVTSPVYCEDERCEIGSLPSMTSDEAVEAIEAAAAAWDRGQGAWPQSSLATRIAAIESLVSELKARRSTLVQVLMWEIGKTLDDASKEFDRTMEFIAATIGELRADAGAPGLPCDGPGWCDVSGVGVRVRRGPIGVFLGLAPFNYPLNEMYAMLIPALLMGNTAVLKLPAVGGLVHACTAAAFAAALPKGVINFVSGPGRVTMAPIMETGLVDAIGFIGGVKGADALIKQHPAPHRLKVFAQLEAKNLGVVMPDADLDVAAAQCAIGATSYNGQRCTAIKLIMVHDSVADDFVSRLVRKVAALRAGLPWEDGVAITPLPEPNKPAYLEGLIADALDKGATLANAERGGGELRGALMTPAVLDRVTSAMRVFHEEQFGPVVPVARYSDLEQVRAALKASWSGQQASLFTADAEAAAPLVDALSSTVGRINLNAAPSRSPDVVPFSGRRSSALGTMSVSEALRAFSVETVVAYPARDASSKQLAEGLESRTAFLAPIA